jgi:cell wall-associated NlpC family hydrolase
MRVPEFIALPWKLGGTDKSGTDCKGLVQMVLDKHLPGAMLPEGDLGRDWSRVDEPQELDVVLMYKPTSQTNRWSLAPVHVGIMVSCDRMLHIREGGRSECPYINAPHIRVLIEGFYRNSRLLQCK